MFQCKVFMLPSSSWASDCKVTCMSAAAGDARVLVTVSHTCCCSEAGVIALHAKDKHDKHALTWFRMAQLYISELKIYSFKPSMYCKCHVLIVVWTDLRVVLYIKCQVMPQHLTNEFKLHQTSRKSISKHMLL